MDDDTNFQRGDVVFIRKALDAPAYIGVVTNGTKFAIKVRWMGIRDGYWNEEDYSHMAGVLYKVGSLPEDAEWDLG